MREGKCNNIIAGTSGIRISLRAIRLEKRAPVNELNPCVLLIFLS